MIKKVMIEKAKKIIWFYKFFRIQPNAPIQSLYKAIRITLGYRTKLKGGW